ncbi:MAG: MerR family transcriptional regulator [Desulfuromusa sp.]|jgi:DNA-binding transcriptional MerR regulator|nr:MerR family transcriptional regulator [Desulfuromusa sp.]
MIKIQQLSQEVGIGVDTLRIWERRYGFPNPERNSRGHRSYPEPQVEELRIVKKMQNLGLQPSKIFALSGAERRELLEQKQSSNLFENSALLRLVSELEPFEIDRELRHSLEAMGPQEFVYQLGLPLIHALDQGWTNGTISIAREHLVSDRLELLLKEQLRIALPQTDRNRLLCLTLSGERHKLGLLMSAVLFQCEGLECLFLNEELPLSEVPLLAGQLGVSGVALSFSAHYSGRQAKNNLATLRNSLDPNIKLIAGGHAVQQKITMPNLFICSELREISTLCRKHFSDHN